MSAGEDTFAFPTKILVDLSPDAIMQITVDDRGYDDGLARQITESLRTTKNPQCFWPTLGHMLRIMCADEAVNANSTKSEKSDPESKHAS